jgi:hypothetical protein
MMSEAGLLTLVCIDLYCHRTDLFLFCLDYNNEQVKLHLSSLLESGNIITYGTIKSRTNPTFRLIYTLCSMLYHL